MVWIVFTAAAFALVFVAPSWAVALCVPAAGVAAWVFQKQRERLRRDRLDALADAIGRIGPGDAPPPEPVSADPFDRLERLVEARRSSVERTVTGLLESRAALRADLNAVDAPVIATDESGRVSLMNRAAERLFRTRPSRAEGMPLEELVTNSVLFDLHARAERGEACRARVRLALDGKPRYYEVSATPVRLDIAEIPARVSQRAGVVLTLRDVHDLAQTLQLRTDFAANASHELRTPIASIRAAIETFQGPALGDPEMQARLVGMIEGNTARLEEMVNDLLDLSNLESEEQPVRLESFDLHELAGSLGAMFEDACRKRGLTLEFDLDPALRSMRTDRKLVLLILRNLIDNATKFAFERTPVVVRGTVEPGGTLAGARLAVIDRGVGIPLKHQQRIFERFYQVDDSRARTGARRGSGLGLSIVRHALRRLEGEIRVDSVWQEGTTMTVTIPRCVASVEPWPEHPAS